MTTRFLALSLLFCLAFANNNRHYFVDSSHGDDMNDGRVPQTAWKTLHRCVRQLHQLESELSSYDVTFHLAGVYELEKPLEIHNIQNGNVLFVSDQGPTTVSGGYKVKGWKKVGKFQQTTLSNYTDEFLMQLWVNGQRRQLANTGELEAASVQQPYVHYQDGQLNGTYSDLSGMLALVWEHWTASYHRIEAIDSKTKTIQLKNMPTTHWFDKRFMLLNVQEELKPGTFHFDQKTKVLTYYPTSSDPSDLNMANVVVARLTELVRLNNTKNHSFKGITWEYTASGLTEYCLINSCDGQSGSFLNFAVIHTTFVDAVSVVGCNVQHTGGYGVWFGQGSHFTSLTSSNLTDLGAGGIRIGYTGGAISDSDASMNNTIGDNRITDGGHIYLEGTGVFAQTVKNIVIEHNEIANLYYSGVCMGWTWGYTPTSCENNMIRFNLIYNIGRGQLSDMGCIYTLGFHKASKVSNNICHDVWTRDYGAWGFYTDEGSRDLTFENNIGYNTQTAVLHQHYGTDNIFNNNVFAFDNGHPCYPHESCTKAILRSSKGRSGKEFYTSFTFKHNLVYIENGTLFYGTSPNSFMNMTFDYNMYWDTTENVDKQKFPPIQHWESFSAWQAKGRDKHSLLDDPLFMDAKNYDFRLKPNSPALKLGIKSIDTSSVGPRG